MTSSLNQKVACPSCHHTDHAISENLESYKLWYGRVRRPAFYCTHCPCTQPMPLPSFLVWKWKHRHDSPR